MNDELYAYAVLRAEQAESYEKNDIKAYIKRIDEQQYTIGAQALQIEDLGVKAEEFKELAKTNGFQAVKAVDLADKEHRKRVRSGRANKVLTVAVGIGCFLLGSR